MLSNRKDNPKDFDINIKDLDVIRIIINQGRGFGHQRAVLSVLWKLRTLGFNGEFDIRYEEFYPKAYHTPGMLKEVGSNGRKIQTLLSGFSPTSVGVVDHGQIINHPLYGKISITRLPPLSLQTKSYNIPPVKLALTGADDRGISDEKATLYNCDIYIGLQPTDWHTGLGRFINFRDGTLYNLPKNLRLTNLSTNTISIYDINLTIIEDAILKKISKPEHDSQLVYGLYSSATTDEFTNQVKKTGSLDPTIEIQRLIEAHRHLKLGKPILLVLPQAICLEPTFIEAVLSNPGVLFMNLTKEKNLQEFEKAIFTPETIVVLYSGALQPQFFEYLLLEGTNYPPVIEGCNSKEACESYRGKALGRSYIHGGAMYAPDTEDIIDQSFKKELDLHNNASKCLKTGEEKYVKDLAQYMLEASAGSLAKYHQARYEAFMSRPDALEYALNTMNNLMQKGENHHKKIKIEPEVHTPSKVDEVFKNEPIMNNSFNQEGNLKPIFLKSITQKQNSPLQIIKEQLEGKLTGLCQIKPNEFGDVLLFFNNKNNLDAQLNIWANTDYIRKSYYPSECIEISSKIPREILDKIINVNEVPTFKK